MYIFALNACEYFLLLLCSVNRIMCGTLLSLRVVDFEI